MKTPPSSAYKSGRNDAIFLSNREYDWILSFLQTEEIHILLFLFPSEINVLLIHQVSIYSLIKYKLFSAICRLYIFFCLSIILLSSSLFFFYNNNFKLFSQTTRMYFILPVVLLPAEVSFFLPITCHLPHSPSAIKNSGSSSCLLCCKYFNKNSLKMFLSMSVYLSL